MERSSPSKHTVPIHTGTADYYYYALETAQFSFPVDFFIEGPVVAR